MRRERPPGRGGDGTILAPGGYASARGAEFEEKEVNRMLELRKVSRSVAGQAHICLPCYRCLPIIVVCSPWTVAHW